MLCFSIMEDKRLDMFKSSPNRPLAAANSAWGIKRLNLSGSQPVGSQYLARWILGLEVRFSITRLGLVLVNSSVAMSSKGAINNHSEARDVELSMQWMARYIRIQ